MIFKSIGRNSIPLANIFLRDERKHEFNLRKEISEIEQDIKMISIEETILKYDLSSNFDKIKANLESEKNLLKGLSLGKSELASVIFGVIFVAFIIALYYVFSSLIKEKD